MDLRFTELMPAAKVVVEDCMQIKANEKVVIVTDTRISDYFGTEPLIQALMAACQLTGCDPNIMVWTSRDKHGMPLPALADDVLIAADAVICVNTGHFIQVPILGKALKSGTRIMILPGGLNVERTEDMIYRAFPKTTAEYEELRDLTRKVGNFFTGGRKKIHITTVKGTDVTLEISDELVQSVCTGECYKPGSSSSIPAGQTAFGVVPGTANGTIVIDASIHPVKRILRDPIIFKVKEGAFYSVEGGEDAEEWKAGMIAVPYEGRTNIAEFGMGCNPTSKIIGNSFEDECVNGAAHIGFGSNMAFGGNIFTDNWHCDGVMLNATVEVDGVLVCKNGEFIL